MYGIFLFNRDHVNTLSELLETIRCKLCPLDVANRNELQYDMISTEKHLRKVGRPFSFSA